MLVADTGADLTHGEIAHLFDVNEPGYNFVHNNTNVRDGNGHGTHVSGLVGGQKVGVATGCQVLAAKVLNDQGFGSESSVVQSLDWAIDNNIHLINMSLGSAHYSGMEAAMIKAVVDAGIVVCAAAGNEGWGASYPAAYPGVISVAAIDRKKRHADFSNIDPSVDISAPGVQVYSCLPGGGYEAWSGTSMATPLVSGSAACVMAEFGSYDLEQKLKDGAEHLGEHDKFGAGLVRPDLVLARRQHARISV